MEIPTYDVSNAGGLRGRVAGPAITHQAGRVRNRDVRMRSRTYVLIQCTSASIGFDRGLHAAPNFVCKFV